MDARSKLTVKVSCRITGDLAAAAPARIVRQFLLLTHQARPLQRSVFLKFLILQDGPR